MRLVVQRVSEADVTIDGAVVGRIARGLCVLVGFGHDDGPADRAFLAEKLVNLRIFPDADGKMNLPLADLDGGAGGGVLLIPNFTLMGECAKGRRPSFIEAMRPDVARDHFEAFVEDVRALTPTVECGVFGADMKVRLINDGPVTLIIDAPRR